MEIPPGGASGGGQGLEDGARDLGPEALEEGDADGDGWMDRWMGDSLDFFCVFLLLKTEVFAFLEGYGMVFEWYGFAFEAWSDGDMWFKGVFLSCVAM